MFDNHVRATERTLDSHLDFQVMLGLPHYHDQFDVVHARACAVGINIFETFIDEMVRCLKPGEHVFC